MTQTVVGLCVCVLLSACNTVNPVMQKSDVGTDLRNTKLGLCSQRPISVLRMASEGR